MRKAFAVVVEQFGKAKNLWKSIARSQEIDVYLYNDITKTTIPYDGDNIPDDQIWGTDFTHMNIVLVGKKNKLVID